MKATYKRKRVYLEFIEFQRVRVCGHHGREPGVRQKGRQACAGAVAENSYLDP